MVAGVLVLSLGLSGCEESPPYSSWVRYTVRTDPLVVAAQPGDLGDEQYLPARPGVMPIMQPKDLLNPDNPMSGKGESLFAKGQLLDPNRITDADRIKLDDALTQLFGTPTDPKVGEISADAREKLGLDDESLKKGAKYYRVNCVHCHGVPGDGRGPTGRWVNPHPRDFRQGLFKFMSVDQTKGKTDLPPRRDDILHTLRHGIESTAMPSFVLLGNKDLNYLVSYVIHLSMRGRVEFDTIKDSFDFKGSGAAAFKQDENGSIVEAVTFWHKKNVEKWVASQNESQAIKVQPYPWDDKGNFVGHDPDGREKKIWDAIKDDDQKWKIRGSIGQGLFNGEQPKLSDAKRIIEIRGDKPASVKCNQCHTDYGRQAKFRFDYWGTLVRPNNFTIGIFRGGRRPVDMYHRVHSGINGSGMTPFGGETLSSNGIWDMVEFVQALSYPAMRKKLGIEID
jgi:mono/diheme cytochrome c family protein